MGFSRVHSAQTVGLRSHIIDIEIDTSKGLHSFTVVGLPDKAVEESRDRVSSAIKNSGFDSPKSKNQKVIISLAPEGGGLPTQQLKDDLKVFLDARKMVGSCVDIIDPVYENAALAGTVFVPKTFTIADVTERVNTALADFFKLGSDSIKFGGTVFLSDVYSLIDAQVGVRNVILTKHTIDPTIRFDLWSGDATIGAISVTKDTVPETWNIVLTSATTFTITGSVSGLQNNVGVFGSTYISDNSEVSFQITAGTVANQVGDRISFVVLPVISDIIVDQASILQLVSNSLVFQSI